MDKDKQAQEAVEETAVKPKASDQPAAGPHAADELTDENKTPGTGLLPEEDDKDVDASSG